MEIHARFLGLPMFGTSKNPVSERRKRSLNARRHVTREGDATGSAESAGGFGFKAKNQAAPLWNSSTSRIGIAWVVTERNPHVPSNPPCKTPAASVRSREADAAWVRRVPGDVLRADGEGSEWGCGGGAWGSCWKSQNKKHKLSRATLIHRLLIMKMKTKSNKLFILFLIPAFFIISFFYRKEMTRKELQEQEQRIFYSSRLVRPVFRAKILNLGDKEDHLLLNILSHYTQGKYPFSFKVRINDLYTHPYLISEDNIIFKRPNSGHGLLGLFQEEIELNGLKFYDSYITLNLVNFVTSEGIRFKYPENGINKVEIIDFTNKVQFRSFTHEPIQVDLTFFSYYIN